MSKETFIQLKLFANLQKYTPPGSDHFAIEAGVSVGALLEGMGVPIHQIKIVFINGVSAELTTTLEGGERVGIFPPVGGG